VSAAPELPDDLQQALAAADAHAPPAPGRDVSPATLHLALAQQRRNRLTAGLAATVAIAGLLLLLLRDPPPLVPIDDGKHEMHADLRAMQAELRAARAFPTIAALPIRSDGTAMHLRVELATVAADACRTHFAPSKETR
jgi:hypothetical protein